MEEPETFLSLLQEKTFVIFLSIVIFVVVIQWCLFSVVVGLLLLIALVSGASLTYMYFREKKCMPDFMALRTKPEKPQEPPDLPHSCSICGTDGCQRLNPSRLNPSSGPSHISFKVPHVVDEAFEEFLTIVLDTYIYSWYKEISVHEQFADEIRYIIRYSFSVIGARITKVDLCSFIINKVIPACISHIDAYVEGTRRVRGNNSVETSILKYLKAGGALHPAVLSRQDEVDYLRSLVSSVYPFLVPHQYQKSRLAKCFIKEIIGRVLILQGMDILATPYTVNFILLLLLEKNSFSHPSSHIYEDVLFLQNFASVNNHPRNSVLRSNLSSILKDQHLLYLFHSFLKEEGGINMLQFCLAVEDFNRHILDPDLNHEQMIQLHHEALELYHSYMASSAVDKIDFSYEVVEQIRDIVHGEVCDIIKLRTTRPLFQAYECAYSTLEKEYLPLFMHSTSYFSYICGSKDGQNVQKSSSKESKGKAVTKRVGSGLKPRQASLNPVPSVAFGENGIQILNSATEPIQYEHTVLINEDGSMLRGRSPFQDLSTGPRDLSAWRVSIPRVETKADPDGKMYQIYIVAVTRIDVTEDDVDEMQWEVERKYHEFYILEAKLTEFHGDLIDNALPPRKALFTSQNANFMFSRQPIFEEYLQKLLQKPALKGSQLLFLFLKSRDEFTTAFLPDVSIRRMIRDVPKKLMKERGQYLDQFISHFLQSSISSKNDLSIEAAEEMTPDYAHKSSAPCSALVSDIFGNNLEGLPEIHHTLLPPHSSVIKVSGIFQSVIFIAVRLYGLSLSAVQWLQCFIVVFGSTTEAYLSWLLRSKLSQYLTADNIAQLVHLARDAIFFDSFVKDDDTEREQERRLRRRVLQLLPRWLHHLIVSDDNYVEGAKILVDVFQHPVLNKQLSYILLDLAVEELFPDVNTHCKCTV